MSGQKGLYIDHIDGNTLNMRKYNLRECTRQENGCNRAKPKNNTSGVKGVTWDKFNEKWMAHLCYKQQRMTLGYFDDLDEATECRKRAEEKYFGEYNRVESVI